jgi:hypothetical protein
MIRFLFISGLAMITKISIAQDAWKIKADKIDPNNYYVCDRCQWHDRYRVFA